MSWKKIALIVGLFLLALGIPMIAISSPALKWYISKFDADPESGFNKGSLFFGAGTAYNLGRYEIAITGYTKYKDWYETSESDNPDPEEPENYPFTIMRLAMSLEGDKQYNEAIDMYDYFMALFPGHEDYEKAKRGIDRIKYVIPNSNVQPN